jgi:hypothetical protein
MFDSNSTASWKGDPNRDAGQAQLTPLQASFLVQRLDEIDLSVRSSNCLKNSNIVYLGELVQYSEADLLRLHNFGRKSLNEIVTLFAKEGLSLGLCLLGWDPGLASQLVESRPIPVLTPPSALLTSEQSAFLAQRLDQLDLSVRSSNCLSTLRIKYLGELVQYSPHELLRIQHFGQKSLNEVIELFARVNLSLGIRIPEWKPDSAGPVAVESIQNTVIGASCEEPLSPSQKAFLAQPLSNFHFSRRVTPIIHRSDLARVGDLAVLSIGQANELVSSDQGALRELSGLLSSERLHFCTYLPDWSTSLATEWEHTYSAEVRSILVRHAIQTSQRSDDSWPFLEEELEQFVRLILPSFGDRNVSIVIRFLGLDGTGKKTLEEVGREFGVTRERVRQITSKFSRRIQHQRSVYLPILRSACKYILHVLPNSSSVISEALCRQQIARTAFDISGIVAILRVLDEEDFFELVSTGHTVLVVEKNTVACFELVPRIARAIVSAFGCGHIEHILADLEAGSAEALRSLDVVSVLNHLPDVRWLNHSREWFTIIDTRRNRLSNVVRKVLSVARKISIAELRGALKRVHRLEGFAPPSDILRAFCLSLPFCEVDDEYVTANKPIVAAETLGEIEHCFYDVLQEHGSVAQLTALRDECLQRGMNANSFYQYITYSPIICRLAPEVYALVGAEIRPGSVEDISQPTVRGPVLIGHGWTEDGRIWISYMLNVSNLRSGVFSLPTGLKGIVSGQYFIQSSGTGFRSVISAEVDRLTGLHRPIAIRGGQPGDVVIVTFNLRQLSAELRFGEGISNADDTDAAALPSNSLVTATVTDDSQGIVISGIDLAGNDKEWSPISTAPMDVNLEVRVEDSFGRYVLLFPCRFVPGEGWINGSLETPLASDPVDWRNWDEASMRF